jgi:nucleotidyltransferase/DNA polymerase involved in DNA repair
LANWICRGVRHSASKICGDPTRIDAHLARAFEAMRDALQPIIAKVWRYCQASGIRGRTVTLKVKFADFQQITRSKSAGEAIDSVADLESLSLGLLEPLLPTSKGVRLLGISLSSLTQAAGRRQLSLDL